VNLTRFPFRAILHSTKEIPLFLCLVALPLVALFYLVKKLARKPFLTPMFHSNRPKLHVAPTEVLRRLRRPSLVKIWSFLADNGFEPLIHLEDRSMVQGNYQVTWVNRRKKIYASVHVSKATGNALYVGFFAFSLKQRYLYLDNAHALPIRYPERLSVKHVPNQPVEATYREFLHALDQLAESTLDLPLKHLLPVWYKLRLLSVALGVKQGFLVLQGTEMGGPETCYHHPMHVAVRSCSECGTLLCEICCRSKGARYYCPSCLPEQEMEPLWKGALRWNERPVFAGLGLRAISTLTDGMVIILTTVGFHFGLTFLLRPFGEIHGLMGTPWILSQFFFVTFSLFYLVFLPATARRSLGRKLWGLQLVNGDGDPPGPFAAVVRFSYQFISSLFLFPLLGYLFIAFRKTKQGLHDQLAGTFVVTQHAGRKAVLSWALLLCMAILPAWCGFKWLMPWFSMFGPFGFKVPSAEITLEPEWVSEFKQETSPAISYVLCGEQCVVCTSSSLQALDLRTGRVLWKREGSQEVRLQWIQGERDTPLLLRQYRKDGSASLLRLHPQSGSVVWAQQLSSNQAILAVDSRNILIGDESSARVYHRDGHLLWERRFRGDLVVEYAVFNGDVLLGRYSSSARSLAYLSRQTGELRWEMKGCGLTPVYPLGEGYQIFLTEQGDTILMHLPTKKSIWQSPRNIGVVLASDTGSLSPHEPAGQTLYTTASAIRGNDGGILFSYPPKTRFGCLTRDFLILLGGENGIEPAPSKEGFLVLDKLTGKVQTALGQRRWLSVVYLSEDQSQVYLVAQAGAQGRISAGISTYLLAMDKRTLEAREIFVGRNIAPVHFRIFPRENLLFIPTYKEVGMYKIPEN